MVVHGYYVFVGNNTKKGEISGASPAGKVVQFLMGRVLFWGVFSPLIFSALLKDEKKRRTDHGMGQKKWEMERNGRKERQIDIHT